MSELGIYLGRGNGGDAYSGNERSTLVLGPSRSGKTSSLVIPNLLMATGAAVATSTKSDVVSTLSKARRDVPQLLFDPSGTVPVPPGVQLVGFSFLKFSKKWDHAVLVARNLAALRSGRSGSDHWTERAAALLAPLLHAAALEDRSLSDLSTSVDERAADRAVAALRDRYPGGHQSISLLDGVLATEERERSSIWSTASGLFDGMRSDAARDASRRPLLDLDAYFATKAQLHIVSASRHQAASVPLVVGILDEIVHATYDRPDAKVLLALDELANVAPLPHLPSIVSEGGGQGVLTLACLQDLSQARQRWGSTADGFLSLFPTAVVLPGIADRPTLELLAALAGRSRDRTLTTQRTSRGKITGFSTSVTERSRATIGDVAQGRSGFALGVDSQKQLRWIELTPAYRDERFRDVVGISRERSR